MNQPPKKKIKIKFTTPINCNYDRFISEKLDIFSDIEFVINEQNSQCDFWFIFDSFYDLKEVSYCNPDNVVLITGEPESVLAYNSDYVKQFATVFTTHSFKHKNKVNKQLLPWMIQQNYDELITMQKPPKDKLISLVCSNKFFTDGHKKRMEFLNILKEKFGDDIDIYGKGIKPIANKWDAIAPYKYHIALENSQIKDYWTEKLADAYLGFSYPLYWGCPNIDKYFSDKSYTNIDILNPQVAINTIKKCIEEDRYQQNIDKIKESRNLVLNKYNMFVQMADYAQENMQSVTNKEKVEIKSEWNFNKNKYIKQNFIKRPFKYTFKILKEGITPNNTRPL